MNDNQPPAGLGNLACRGFIVPGGSCSQEELFFLTLWLFVNVSVNEMGRVLCILQGACEWYINNVQY